MTRLCYDNNKIKELIANFDWRPDSHKNVNKNGVVYRSIFTNIIIASCLPTFVLLKQNFTSYQQLASKMNGRVEES